MTLKYTPIHAGQSIVGSSLSEETLTILNTVPTVYNYSESGVYQGQTLLKGFKSNIDRYAKALSISSDGKYSLLCDTSNNKVLLFNLIKKRIASSMPMRKGPRFSLFSSNSNYFACSNSVGEFDIYETLSCEVYNTILFVDSVSAAIFSDDELKIAIATFDKKVHIYDMLTKEIESTFIMEDYVEGITFSQDNTSVVVFTRIGNSYILNLKLDRQYMADPCFEWPTVIIKEKGSTISLVGVRSNQLFIYTNGNKIAMVPLDYWGVTSISIYKQKVFLGFCDGNGIIIDNTKAIEEVMHAIEESNYEKLSLLVYDYPLVFTSISLTQKIEEQYLDILKHKPLGHNEKLGYESLVSFLLSANVSRKELLQALYTLPEIVDFMSSVSTGSLSEACNIAYNTPLLRQLREFNEIKTNCSKELQEKMHLLETNFNKFDEDKSSSCSECVLGILPSDEILKESYNQLMLTGNAKNCAAVIDITDRYPILRQTKIYRRLLNQGEAFIHKTLLMISAGKMDEANIYATNLTRMKPFAATGLDFKRQIEAYTMFEKACIAKNLTQIFSLIEKYPLLRTTDIFKTFVLYHKESILKPALAQAKLGAVEQMKKIIEKYSDFEYFDEKHFHVYKIALIREIEKYAPTGKEEELLDKYHAYFGWDKYYESVCISFECLPNPLVKTDEVAVEHKKLMTLLDGERVLRVKTNTNINKGKDDE